MKKYILNTSIKAFTFVELIIVTTIIIILSSIGFSSYIWYIADSRDTQRKSDLLQVNSAFKVYKQKRWYYWFPWNYFIITYSGSTVVLQWKLNKNVHVDSLEKLPLDPLDEIAYSYSITNNKQEFQLAATLENKDTPKAIVIWNYKSVSNAILPTITLAKVASEWDKVEIKDWSWSWSENRKLFVYNNNIHNLAYNFNKPYEATTDWLNDYATLQQEAINSNDFWQNSDYRNCVELKEAWKLLIEPAANSLDSVEYQIINNSGALISTWCTITNTQ